jgi:hypothetical protein
MDKHWVGHYGILVGFGFSRACAQVRANGIENCPQVTLPES